MLIPYRLCIEISDEIKEAALNGNCVTLSTVRPCTQAYQVCIRDKLQKNINISSFFMGMLCCPSALDMQILPSTKHTRNTARMHYMKNCIKLAALTPKNPYHKRYKRK